MHYHKVQNRNHVHAQKCTARFEHSIDLNCFLWGAMVLWFYYYLLSIVHPKLSDVAHNETVTYIFYFVIRPSCSAPFTAAALTEAGHWYNLQDQDETCLHSLVLEDCAWFPVRSMSDQQCSSLLSQEQCTWLIMLSFCYLKVLHISWTQLSGWKGGIHTYRTYIPLWMKRRHTYILRHLLLPKYSYKLYSPRCWPGQARVFTLWTSQLIYVNLPD
jgi:hypothetical protein